MRMSGNKLCLMNLTGSDCLRGTVEALVLLGPGP